jgi:type II secretory pathway pseudopilin PulG
VRIAGVGTGVNKASYSRALHGAYLRHKRELGRAMVNAVSAPTADGRWCQATPLSFTQTWPKSAGIHMNIPDCLQNVPVQAHGAT